jgi:sortase A
MKNKQKGSFFVSVGLLLIAAALALVCYNRLENCLVANFNEDIMGEMRIVMAEITVSEAVGLPSPTVSEIEYPDYVLNPNMDMPVKKVDGHNYSSVLQIPSINLELPILSNYVYDHLRRSPCRYLGSPYTKDMVICAHNYEVHFGNLKHVSVDDEVILTDMDGNVFRYRIAEVVTLDPYVSAETLRNGYALTLFTCTVGGRSRVVVHCELESKM